MDGITERDAAFQKLLKEMVVEQQREFKSMVDSGQLGLKMGEDSDAEYIDLLKKSGVNVEPLELQERKDAEATEKWIAEVTPALVMGGDEQSLVLQQLAEERSVSLEQSQLKGDTAILTPSALTVSDSDNLTMDLIPNNTCWNAYAWARGAGWGCVGGRASKQVCVDWYYWFKPKTTKFYGIIPKIDYRGFYLVKANDKWYNCKYARVKIDIGVNVHQYNWKGWSSWNIHNVGDDNISVNRRFDTIRAVNYSALLNANDWALIRVRTCLDVYAKGSGSYAELNFSAGSNRICAKPLYVG